MRTGILLRVAVIVTASCTQADEDTFVLPDWFEGSRVQAHSEHGLTHALRMTPQGHAEVIRALGANVLTRIYLTRDEGAWWQSAVGEINPLIGDREFAREISDAVHAQGMKVIAYQRHQSDAAMQTQHPDWVCKHPDGKPVLEPRGKTKTVFILCMNSPYRDYIKTRLVELADRGVDAIYFDSWHMPDICACDYCKKAFRKEMGHDLDLSAPVGSPGYMEGVEFVNRTMVRTFSEWREAVRARHPNVFFSIKSSRYPMFFNPHIDSHLLAISDTSGTEFHKPFGHSPAVMRDEPDFAEPAWDDQLAMGWSLVRDGSDGRPPLMWIPFIRTERASLYSAAAAVTYGCIAAMNIRVRDLERDAERNLRIFPSSFKMGAKISPYLKYARPIPWAALHVSERSRNARLADVKRMWREIFSPVLGAYQVLKEEHLPWVTFTDGDLAKGPVRATKVLVLPWPDELSDEQKDAVEKFETAGGLVVRLDPRAGWHTTTRKPVLMKTMHDVIEQKAGKPPVDITGPKAMHAVCYDRPESNRLTVCLTNTWGWFRSTKEPNPRVNEGTPPPACSDVSIEFSRELGKPNRIFEVLSGKELPIEASDVGARVSIPQFQINACVVMEF